MQVIVYKCFPINNYILFKLKKKITSQLFMIQIQLTNQTKNKHNTQTLKKNQIKDKHTNTKNQSTSNYN